MKANAWCHKFHYRKTDANRDARLLKQFGAKSATVTGRRGLWRVRANIAVALFVDFCAAEDRRKANK